MFWETIDEELVFTELQASSKDEVFETLGGRLENLGKCKNTYVEALKEREKGFPTGVLVGDAGVAIPHTDPEHVIESAVSIATLKEPVDFYHMGTNPEDEVVVPVTYVIMLAIGGRDHLDMLQKVIQLIQDPKVLIAFREAKSKKEIIQIIKEKEESNENV